MFTVFSIVFLALVVPGLELLPEPALVHQLLLVVRLRRENIHQMRKFRVKHRSHHDGGSRH